VVELLALNRGRISPLALARTDFKRTALSAEVQTNFMPRALGSMSLRAGLKYTGASKNNAQSRTIPFVKASDDTARVELTNALMRVWVNDVLVTRASVTSAITNGTFATDVSGWSDQDGGSAVSSWVDGTAAGLTTGGYLSLIGTTTAAAKRRQQVTCAGANIGVRHALNITIARGPVLIRGGSTAGGDEYITETTLETGYHSLAFTPTGDFHIDLFNYNEAASFVDSIVVASAGTMELTAPWLTADLADLRWDQSGDVVFVACDGFRPRRIERRATDSWSIVEYKSDDGPFMVQNTGPITLTPGAVSGDTTLTASAPLFKSTQIGGLFKLVQTGQSQNVSVTGADQWSAPIRVSGVDGTRIFSIFLTGTWVATVTLQYSVSEPGSWVDAVSGTFTANTAISYDDTLDNQVLYYRIGVKAGNYTSGTVVATLSYSSGTQTGIARVVSYTSTTVVGIAVLAEFSAAAATSEWSESYWSDYRGYPTAVAFSDGRLWWFGQDRAWGSISDDYDSFDDTVEGDAGPISRSIGSGPVAKIRWAIAAKRILLGADCDIFQIFSSSLDEPITPTNLNIKAIDTPGSGSANVAAIRSGTSAAYIQQSGQRAYEGSVGDNGYDYQGFDLSVHVPEIGEPSIIKVVEQNQPERRRHYIRSDGTVAVYVLDKAEEVAAWIDVETNGDVEDAVVLPGTVEDEVYYTVKRTINAATVRYHEKFALESECRGFPQAKLADAFIEYSGAAVTAITGLSALEGATVVCWGWNTTTPFLNADGVAIGRYFGTFTVSGGQITGLSAAVTNAIVGLAYTAQYKSTKLARAEGELGGKKKVVSVGFIARWLHASGVRYGPSFDYLDDLPLIESGAEVDSNDVREMYDEGQFTFPGTWDEDSRICFEATAPKPCTILACLATLDG